MRGASRQVRLLPEPFGVFTYGRHANKEQQPAKDANL